MPESARLTAYIVIGYLMPILFFSIYSVSQMSADKSWFILMLGWILAIAGAFFLLHRLRGIENSFSEQLALVRQKSTPPQVSSLRQFVSSEHSEERTQMSEQQEDLIDELREKNEKLQELREENESLHRQIEQFKEESQNLQTSWQDTLKKKEVLLSEYAQTIEELELTMKKKQQEIAELEGSVSDLSYDVETLLNLSQIEPTAQETPHEAPPPSPANPQSAQKVFRNSEQEATEQLRRCINTAQKMTGASHFNSTQRYGTVTLDNFALDQRRLYESLRSEKTSAVLVYSQKEGQLLFSNDMVRDLFGWSPENFVEDFPELIHEGWADWKQNLKELKSNTEKELRLLVKTRSGEEKLVQCFMGLIPTGVFKHFVIAVMYPL